MPEQRRLPAHLVRRRAPPAKVAFLIPKRLGRGAGRGLGGAIAVIAQTPAESVEQLGGRQAAVMGLRYYGGLSQSETAATIGISKDAVARAEASAIKTLRALLRLPRRIPKPATDVPGNPLRARRHC